MFYVVLFFFSSRRRHTRCALVTGVQTCALPIFQRVVAKQVPLSPGVSIAYSGQFEYLQHAIAKLKLVVPATLLIIFVLLYMTFGRFDDAALIMGTLPFALTGGIWRSEEHTSELQSLMRISYAVFCLKKKNNTT